MHINAFRTLSLACALTVLAACNGSGDTTGDGQMDGSTQAGSETTGAAAATDTPSPGATADVVSENAAGLSAYIGKYVTAKVDGVSWMEHPAVVAGLRKSVTDAAVLKAITETPGPTVPIALHEDKISSWACEVHNCGNHQWAIMVDPASGATDVCYHNAEKLQDKSRWFLASGKEEQRDGNCSIE